MKSEKRIEARKLRSQGWATGKIAEKLEVSKSTISLWVRDILLTAEQIKVLEKQNPIRNKQLCGAKSISDSAKKTRLDNQNEGKLKAKENNLLHHAGCMLYWAEGTKNKNQIRFTNSDVNMVKLFLRFLREELNVSDEKIIMRLNCYTTNGLSKDDIEKFWMNELSLNKSNFRKGQENLKPRSVTNAIRHNKLIYGIICIEVYSTKLVQHIYGAIQEYAGFNNDYMI